MRRLEWWHGWGPLAVLPGAVLLVGPATWPRWALMWTLAFAIYCGCKWLTWRRTPVPGAPLWRHLGYLLAWPGMDAAAFLDPRRAAPPPPGPREWTAALGKTALGLGILAAGVKSASGSPSLASGWIGMIGIVLMLHFGIFHLLSCAWRRAGIDAPPLMSRPAASVSVGEFWGRRWNRAFRDLTHRFVFSPVARRFGTRVAIAAGFAVSGLVHDLVISLPAGAGYGGPSLFFAVQGAAILAERSAVGRGLGLGRGRRGWLFTAAVLLSPVYALFHPPFVRLIMVPFLRALGAT